MRIRSTHRLFWVPAFGIVACLAAGCGGGDSQSAESETAAPAAAPVADAATCPFVSASDVGAAVGRGVYISEFSDNGDPLRTCSFRDPDRPSLRLVAVAVTTGDQAKTIFETHKSLATSPMPVPGLGDDAFWEQGDNDLEVAVGNHVLVITVEPEASGDQVAAAQAIATKALPSLE